MGLYNRYLSKYLGFVNISPIFITMISTGMNTRRDTILNRLSGVTADGSLAEANTSPSGASEWKHARDIFVTYPYTLDGGGEEAELGRCFFIIICGLGRSLHSLCSRYNYQLLQPN